MLQKKREFDEIEVTLDRLDYFFGGENTPKDTPHVFVYHISIHNQSDQTVTLLGRKWVIRKVNGERQIVEGDKIVGVEPVLDPGRTFSYNSFHLLECDAIANGSFLGIDETGEPFFARIPEFEMNIRETPPPI